MLGLDSLRNDGNEECSQVLIDSGAAPPRAECGAIKRYGEKQSGFKDKGQTTTSIVRLQTSTDQSRVRLVDAVEQLPEFHQKSVSVKVTRGVRSHR